MSHETAGDSFSGAHWKQFIAERGIEYGLHIVTPNFLNPPHCLYLKKSCKFLQSYEKTSEMHKEKFFFFSFPSAKDFGEAKVTKKDLARTQRSRVPAPLAPLLIISML